MIVSPNADRRAYERLRELLPEIVEAIRELIRNGHTPEQIVAVLKDGGPVDDASSEGREAGRLVLGAAQHIEAAEQGPRIVN